MISVKILGKQREYPYGTPYSKIAEDYRGITRHPIVLVMKDKKLCELHKKLKKDGELELLQRMKLAIRLIKGALLCFC